MTDEARGFVCGCVAVVLFSASRSAGRNGAAHVQKEILALFVKQQVHQIWCQMLWEGLDGKSLKVPREGMSPVLGGLGYFSTSRNSFAR